MQQLEDMQCISNFDYYYYNLKKEMDNFYETKGSIPYDVYMPYELLVINRKLYNLTLEEIEVYALLMQRQIISINHNWIDKDSEHFFFFKMEELSKLVNKDRRTISRYLSKFEHVGLLKRIRMGLGLPNRLYVKVLK